MAQQKRPLFSGGIPLTFQTSDTGVDTPIFTPPDVSVRAPQTYELHLWAMSIADAQSIQVIAQENASGKQSLAWSGKSSTDTKFVPVKVLDGYPVRGDVSIFVRGKDTALVPKPGFMWGFYYAVGAGRIREDERRFMGRTLAGFNAGLGLSLSTQPSIFPAPNDNVPQGEILHVFDPSRIDEISIAFTPFVTDPTAIGVVAALSFEKVDNTVLSVLPVVAKLEYGPNVLPAGAYPPSPYILHKIPFGGDVSAGLHHIRAFVGSGFAADPEVAALTGAVGVHGYFTRR